MNTAFPRSSIVRRRLRAALAAVLCAAASAQALAVCDGDIRLKQPVALSAAERADIAAMAPLTVLAVDAPPMARWDPEARDYSGVAVDVLCVIAAQTGLRYVIEPGRDQTVASKIARVQNGHADVFLSLSAQPERAARGLFTRPYYESYYAVIARKGARLQVQGLADLASHRVGVVKGVAFEPILRQSVGAGQLVTFDQASSDGMFEALREGTIDVAVYPQGIFAEKRYQHEYFDLEVVHVLRGMPRAYGFYFSPSPAHERLVAVFDRYLEAMDFSRSVAAHEDGERQFIERYVAQRSQRIYWQVGTAAAGVLAVVFFVALRRYRRLTRQLAERSQRVMRQQRALVSSHRKLERLSQTDGLTGLANRRELDHVLAREHQRRRRTGTPLSVMMIDIDHFKCVNDHYGHAMGDDYLRAVARALGVCVARPADLAARYGGEEFVCLLPDTGPQDAVRVAERIRAYMAELQLPNAAAPHPVLTLSLGVATQVGGNASAAQLLQSADEALYVAKHAGRDRIHAVTLGA